MKDTDQGRFARWGIPGWMMFLSFLSFLVIDITLTPDSTSNALYSSFNGLTGNFQSSSTTAIMALLVAAAGIPIGFFIYQLYFYVRWNSPFSRDGLFPPFIMGRLMDLERTMAGIDDMEIAGKSLWRNAWVSDPLFQIDHGWKWRYIENYFVELMQKLDTDNDGLSLYTRFRYLMDLMHTLGAGLFGIYLGYLAYLMTKVKIQQYSLTILLIISIGGLALLTALLELEDQARREKNINFQNNRGENYLAIRPFKRLPSIQYANPCAIFLFICFIFLYLGSPSPHNIAHTSDHIIFRISILVMVAAAGWFSNRRHPNAILVTELLTLILFGGVAGITAKWMQTVFNVDWWNIGWAILIFLCTNMVFIKNRQNARDDVIILQNYTFKRVLKERESIS